MTPQRLADMQPTERRRAFLRVAGRILVTWAVVLGAYFLVPVGNDTTSGTAVKLVIVLFLVVGVIAWQLRRILRAKYPELRAIEALGVILVAFLALFSALYLSMSHNSASNFTQPLNHMGALYFTVTLFSTVGFGDITAKTEAARAVVTLQMVLDLVLLGALVRLLTTAARTGLGQQDG